MEIPLVAASTDTVPLLGSKEKNQNLKLWKVVGLGLLLVSGLVLVAHFVWNEDSNDFESIKYGVEDSNDFESNKYGVEGILAYPPKMSMSGCKTQSKFFHPPRCVAAGVRLAVRCCSYDGKKCYSERSGKCFPKAATYSLASRICSIYRLRLCTLNELDNGVCCKTPCDTSSLRVWSKSNCAALTQAKETLSGCKKNPSPKSKHPLQCTNPNTKLAVRCCTKDGKKCYSGQNRRCFLSPVDYRTARYICTRYGLRLCTFKEVDSGLCCGTGCYADYKRIWTEDNCSLKPLITTSGCKKDLATFLPPQCTKSTDSFAVRCCDRNGRFCKSGYKGKCFPKTVKHDLARRICQSVGLRLCTFKEVNSGLCCRTGCLYDRARIWTQSGCSTPPQKMTLSGCRAFRSPKNNHPLLCAAGDTKLAVTCCSKDGKTCVSSYKGKCFTASNYMTAEFICSRIGMRLCTYKEVAYGRCCNKGCYVNIKRVWTQNTCSHRYVASTSGCPKYRQKAPTKCLNKYSGRYAVRCCAMDGSKCVSQIKGKCLPKYYSYSGAAYICKKNGLRLCTYKEVDSGLCCNTGCYYDFARIWTKSSCA